MRRLARSVLLIGLAAVAAAVVAGCGDSGGSTTATSGVSTARLGGAADTATCPSQLGGRDLATRMCPPAELPTQTEWARDGRPKGAQFVVTTPDIVWDTTDGFVKTVWCPKYDSIPLAGRHWGVQSTANLQELTAKEHRDTRGARGMTISWSGADTEPSTSRMWIICRGSASTFMEEG